MRGVLKGFKYISQMFDDEQEKEMQIGLPTDVKHVAHIGLDGPSSETPSWMKKFKGQERAQSAPLDTNEEPERQRAQSAPLDSNGNSIDSSSQDTSRNMPNLPPKASRRRFSADNLTIETRDLTSKSKGSRRHRKKESSEGSANKSGRRRHHRKDSASSDHEGSSRSGRSNGYDSASPLPSPSSPTPRKLPDIPKSTRRKKVKDESSKSSSKSEASSNVDVPPTTTRNVSCNNETCQISSSLNPPLVEEEEKRELVG